MEAPPDAFVPAGLVGNANLSRPDKSPAPASTRGNMAAEDVSRAMRRPLGTRRASREQDVAFVADNCAYASSSALPDNHESRMAHREADGGEIEQR